jgi:hypothetical protein
MSTCATALGNTEQVQKPQVVSTVSQNGGSIADVVVPLIVQPLTLADFPTMALRPELRDRIGYISGFIQNQPSDGHPATLS